MQTMGAKEVHTEPIDSEILKSSEPMHNPAEAQMLSSESNPSTNKGSVTSSNMRSDSLASAQQTSGHVQDELDKPHGLVDVIEKLSFEEFPEYVRKNDSTLTFPEKLMLMLIHVERVYAKQAKKMEDQSISWSNNGKSFVIRDKDALCKAWVPAFFGQAKFSSFTRKLYRWGFRKVNVSINDKGEQIVVFSNENFQRDDVSRLSKMQSITAAKIRNQLAVKSGSRKEPIPDSTSVGTSGNASEQPSAMAQFLRERFATAGAGGLANSSILQYRQEREQEILRNRSLLASRLNSTRFPTCTLPTVEDTSLLARQQALLNRYRQPSIALPTATSAGNSSALRLSLAARPQLENLRLLEALDRQRAVSLGSLTSDGTFEQLLLQRQLRAARVPSADLTNMQALDAYALIRRELGNNLLGQNLSVASLQQQLENRTTGNVDRQYLAALAALLQQRNNR